MITLLYIAFITLGISLWALLMVFMWSVITMVIKDMRERDETVL